MKITNQDLDQAILHFENKQFSDDSEKEFIGQFPEILSYLTSNQFSILSEYEYVILFFDSMILLKTILEKHDEFPIIDNNIIEVKETENWDKFESLGNVSFDDKADEMFNFKQDDLVEFILSSLEDDEEEDNEEISAPAKEVIFMALKTILDSFRFE